MVEKPATSAHSLFEAATSYERACRSMINDGEHPLYREQIPAFYLLLGFAYETVLKSHLRLLGLSDYPDLKKISHDLEQAALAVAARIDDQSELPSRLWEVIRQLNPHHVSLAMRYLPASGDFVLAHPKVALNVLGELTAAMAWRLRDVPDE